MKADQSSQSNNTSKVEWDELYTSLKLCKSPLIIDTESLGEEIPPDEFDVLNIFMPKSVPGSVDPRSGMISPSGNSANINMDDLSDMDSVHVPTPMLDLTGLKKPNSNQLAEVMFQNVKLVNQLEYN